MGHQVKGNPIIPFAHDSSLGCAICDPVIAVWCFMGGLSPRELLRKVRSGKSQGHDTNVPADPHTEAGRPGRAVPRDQTAGAG